MSFAYYTVYNLLIKKLKCFIFLISKDQSINNMVNVFLVAVLLAGCEACYGTCLNVIAAVKIGQYILIWSLIFYS